MFDFSVKKRFDKLYRYMISQGLVFSSINIDDTSPYAILKGKTSLGYRTTTNKWPEKGIVFFCAKDGVDKNALSKKLSLKVYDNSDSVRPYAIFIPDSKFEKAVNILKLNPKNINEETVSTENEIKVNKQTNKKYSRVKGINDSYKEFYRNEYFDFLKIKMSQDGYSNSDSNVNTTLSDTFYLERQRKDRDFLSWFENEETKDSAKKEIVRLLKEAKRKGSNLQLDIKYYWRDFDYFAEFLDRNNSDDSEYRFISYINLEKGIKLVQHLKTNQYMVKKVYDNYDIEVLEMIKDLKLNGLPEIYELKEIDGKLYTLEEYIPGQNLLEIMKQKGEFTEEEVRNICLKICDVVNGLHEINPPLIHRDIKPSNIIMDTKGKITLIDFNTVRRYDRDNCQDTVFAGTMQFEAPEQHGYGQSNVTTDIYGIGATMSYILTGQYVRIMCAPGKYKEVWLKCTELASKDRYQSSKELKQAILDLDV